MSGPSAPNLNPGYQLSGQPRADQGFQSLLTGAQPYAQQLPGQVIPGLASGANNIVNNPYNTQAQQGANAASATGAGVAYNSLLGSNTLGNLGWNDAQMAALTSQGASQASAAYGRANQIGNQAAGVGASMMPLGGQVYGQGQTGYNQTQGLIPSTTGGAAYAPGAMANAQGLANLSAGAAYGAIPGLTGGMGAADQILQTGFDPQQALYQRGMQQTTDQANAVNAMYGLGNSAAGAGTANTALSNFNIDWQNNQLQRQATALGAYGQEQGQVASNLTNLLNTGTNDYATLSGLGVNQYNALTSGAVGNLSNLVNTGMGAATSGFNAQNAAANTNLQGLSQQQAGLTSAVNNYNSLTSTAAANQATLSGAAGSAAETANNLGVAGTQLQASAAGLPASTYQGQQQAGMGALQNLASGAGSALNPGNSLAGLYTQYLQTGMNATDAYNRAQMQLYQAQVQNQQGIGQMLGTVAGIGAEAAMHFL